VSANKPKRVPKGDYPVGFARPPKWTQFPPGHSGNPTGRPRGRPSLDELFLEEAARIVKFKVGDKTMHMDRDRGVTRRAFDMALQGNMRAIQYVTEKLRQAQASQAARGDPEPPLTEEEHALLAMLSKNSGG
jgi:hypothetical protein